MLTENDLTKEQQAAITRLVEYDETLLIAGVGFGKAIVGLTACKELLKMGAVKRFLVLAPLRVATHTWGTEPANWAHIDHKMVAVACGTPEQRAAAVTSGAQVVVTNFENVDWMLDQHGGDFDGMLVDELSKLKAPGGARVRRLRRWIKSLTWRAGMSATPVAECGSDIYAQALLLDLGKALGTNQEQFLRRYFIPSGKYKWQIAPGANDKIATRLQGLVFMADDKAYQASLPDLIDHVIEVPMGVDTACAYGEMERNFAVELDPALINGLQPLPMNIEPIVLAHNAGVQTGKLQQIACGALYLGDDESTLAWVSPDKEKQHALRGLLRYVSRPVVIVYQYAFERQWLTGMFPGAPVLGGGKKPPDGWLGRWNSGDIPILIMHPRSAGHGLNLQYSCDTMIFLGPVWSADGWQQSIGRLRRRGSPYKEIHRYTLVSVDSLEQREMRDRVKAKKIRETDMMEALIRAT